MALRVGVKGEKRMDGTMYLFNEEMFLRAALVSGVREQIHKEAAHLLSARIPAFYGSMPGEFLGFHCVDARFRMFVMDDVELDDDTGEHVISATDAAVAELADAVAMRVSGKDMTAQEAMESAIDDTEFVIGEATEDGETASHDERYEKVWPLLQKFEEDHNVRVIPYYEFNGNAISGKKIDIISRTPVFRGRVLEAADGASGVVITKSGRPMTDAYGFGAVIREDGDTAGNTPKRVTISSAVWDTEDGDPADKPKNQAYIVNPAVVSAQRRSMVFSDENEDDPKKLLKKTWEALIKQAAPRASGSAVAQDVEMTPGMEHKQIRLYDKIGVKARNGETAETTVIDIDRNYVHRNLTKITMGEDEREKKSLSNRVSSINRSEGRTRRSSAANCYHIIKNTSLIQANAELVQINAANIQANAENIELNAEVIAENARLIALKADRIDLQGYVTISNLYAELSALSKIVAKQIDVSGSLSCNGFTFKALPISNSSMRVVTGVTISEGSYANVRLGDDTTELIPSSYKIETDKDTIYYLDWE